MKPVHIYVAAKILIPAIGIPFKQWLSTSLRTKHFYKPTYICVGLSAAFESASTEFSSVVTWSLSASAVSLFSVTLRSTFLH